MQQLYPEHRSMALDELHAGLTLHDGGGAQRTWLAIGMVATLDGAATVGGRTDALGGEADHRVFTQLRAAADTILVGAGTVRAEDYGPAAGPAARREDRAARGLDESPRLVIVSGSLDLGPELRVFSDPQHRPLVVTSGRASEVRAAGLAEVAEVVRVGDDALDVVELLDQLASRDLRRVLCEGGPRLNGHLLAEDLVDEVFLTVAPSMFAGDAPRIAHGDRELPPRGFTLASIHEHEDELLLRYRRAR